MKALPPPTSQMELWSKRKQLAMGSNDRQRVLRALAEILLVAADVAAAQAKERGNETP